MAVNHLTTPQTHSRYAASATAPAVTSSSHFPPTLPLLLTLHLLLQWPLLLLPMRRRRPPPHSGSSSGVASERRQRQQQQQQHTTPNSLPHTHPHTHNAKAARRSNLKGLTCTYFVSIANNPYLGVNALVCVLVGMKGWV